MWDFEYLKLAQTLNDHKIIIEAWNKFILMIKTLLQYLETWKQTKIAYTNLNDKEN